MGYVPPPPMPRNADQAAAWLGPGLLRRMGRRRSRFAFRRRDAYRACLTMTRIRQAQLGLIPDPWLAQDDEGRDLIPVGPAWQ